MNICEKNYVVEEKPTGFKTEISENKRETTRSPKEPAENTAKTAQPQLSSNQIRTVVIMVILAGTFSITFLMGLSFGYVFALRNFDDYSSLSEIVALFTCYRLYFLNYALNPVVYFALDRQFRAEVIKIFIDAKTFFRK